MPEPQRPRILVNSLPKGGTHLVSRALQLLLDLPDPGMGDRLAIGQYESPTPSGQRIMIGIASPRPASTEALERGLRDVKPGHYVNAHLPYQPEVAELVRRLEMKCIVVLRDPRDVVVSQSHYAVRETGHRLHRLYREMTPEQRLRTSILGLESVPPDGLPMIDINRRVRSILPWREEPETFTCIFERLIGSAGGGSAEMQRREIGGLARHLGVERSADDTAAVCERLFGNTATFRKGQIGAWREHFTADDKRLFKEIAGELLIELSYEKDMDW